MAGRPTKYTPELVAEICERLSKGEPLAVICRDGERMPHPSTFRDWMANDQSISDLVAWARVDGFDNLAAQALEIANAPMLGDEQELERVLKPKAHPDDVDEFEMRVVKIKRSDMIAHRRLQIDTILKLLAKWDPKRYGDKVQLADADGNQLPPATFVLQPVMPAPRNETE